LGKDDGHVLVNGIDDTVYKVYGGVYGGGNVSNGDDGNGDGGNGDGGTLAR